MGNSFDVGYYNPEGKLIRPLRHVHNSGEEYNYICLHDKTNFEANDECYVIHADWMTTWIDWVKQIRNPPGSISNQVLIKISRCRKLKPRKDFKVVSKAVWEYLYERYGGGPVLYLRVPNRFRVEQYHENSWVRYVDFHQDIVTIYPKKYNKPSVAASMRADEQQALFQHEQQPTHLMQSNASSCNSFRVRGIFTDSHKHGKRELDDPATTDTIDSIDYVPTPGHFVGRRYSVVEMTEMPLTARIESSTLSRSEFAPYPHTNTLPLSRGNEIYCINDISINGSQVSMTSPVTANIVGPIVAPKYVFEDVDCDSDDDDRVMVSLHARAIGRGSRRTHTVKNSDDSPSTTVEAAAMSTASAPFSSNSNLLETQVTVPYAFLDSPSRSSSLKKFTNCDSAPPGNEDNSLEKVSSSYTSTSSSFEPLGKPQCHSRGNRLHSIRNSLKQVFKPQSRPTS